MRTRIRPASSAATVTPAPDGATAGRHFVPQSNALRSREWPVGSTRASRVWVRVLPAMVLLAVILVFVFQNLQHTKVNFVTASGSVPIAIALLVAAALGGLLVLAVGSIRIFQLRGAVRRASSMDPAGFETSPTLPASAPGGNPTSPDKAVDAQP